MATLSPSARAARAAVFDLVSVILFVLVGRVSHGEAVDAGGVLSTAWPFLVGLAIGWIASVAWRRPYGVVRPGLIVWASTVVLGVLLRFVTGVGAETSFIVVTAVVLGALLVGWRAFAMLLSRRRIAA
ncbi:DUF3054 domain-containing protein [Planctomonas deserti]|uniref:DUF3054 domain-containing protein n=1 Tax=Planctomonas deserti TaxID=2144185 RepID=UPI000D3A2C59|nr:DUF3054 domain-containing protein [Planctomonas deserti]